MSKLLKKVCSLPNLEASWLILKENARLSGSERIREEVVAFQADSGARLRSLQHRLSRGKFEFAPSRGVPLPKGGKRKVTGDEFRPIVIAPIESRIVQRSILNVLCELPTLRQFIRNPYSFGGLRKEPKDQSLRGDAPTAVPGAIFGVVSRLNQGDTYYATADISGFFTKISKSAVIEKIACEINDAAMIDLFSRALTVELSNLAELRGRAQRFPTQDIGVAQGSSLSPMMGNIILSDFDQVMNAGECRCIRYIDDFIILGPSQAAVDLNLNKARRLLLDLGMELSPGKSSAGACMVSKGISFLGVEINPGFVRPSRAARIKFLQNIERQVTKTKKAMAAFKSGSELKEDVSLVPTLRRIGGMISGWGKHYWFCNDGRVLHDMDIEISKKISDLIGCYTAVRRTTDITKKSSLLGIPELARLPREPFSFGKAHSNPHPSSARR